MLMTKLNQDGKISKINPIWRRKETLMKVNIHQNLIILRKYSWWTKMLCKIRPNQEFQLDGSRNQSRKRHQVYHQASRAIKWMVILNQEIWMRWWISQEFTIKRHRQNGNKMMVLRACIQTQLWERWTLAANLNFQSRRRISQ